MPRGFDLDAATEALARRDRALGRWMRRIGPLDMDGWRQPFETVDALARAILYQQLSGKAAATIVGRVEAAVGASRLTGQALARVDDPTLRACGVSGNKVLALCELCRRDLEGDIPSARRLPGFDDKGAARLDGLDPAPTPKQLLERGEAWAPYRTLASLYLWRIADGEGVPEPAKRPRRSQE